MKVPVNLSVKLVLEVEKDEDSSATIPSASAIRDAVRIAIIELFAKARRYGTLSEAIEDELYTDERAAFIHQDYTEVTLNEEQP